jgi:hypothetical protein
MGFGIFEDVSDGADRTLLQLGLVLALVLVGLVADWRWARRGGVAERVGADADVADRQEDVRRAKWVFGSALVTAVLLATDVARSEIGGWVTAGSAAVTVLTIFWVWATR